MRKSYWTTLIIFSALLVAVTVFALSWLGSNSEPSLIASQFDRQLGRLSFYTPVFFVILVILSNMIYFKRKKVIFFAWSWLFLTFFNVIDWFWLHEKVSHFRNHNGLRLDEPSLSGFAGIIISLSGLVLVTLNILMFRLGGKKKHKR